MSETELELSARLFRALTHRIRGDLSVITNDLAYLSSVVDPSEMERPRTRCAQIATTLSALSALSKATGREALSFRDAAALFSVTDLKPEYASHHVSVDKTLLREALTLTRELVGTWTGVQVSAGPDGTLALLATGLKPMQLKRSYSSISSFASSELGEKSVVEGCVIDLIFREHGWKVEVAMAEDAPILRFDIPITSSKSV